MEDLLRQFGAPAGVSVDAAYQGISAPIWLLYLAILHLYCLYLCLFVQQILDLLRQFGAPGASVGAANQGIPAPIWL